MSFQSDWREGAVLSRLICGGSPGPVLNQLYQLHRCELVRVNQKSSPAASLRTGNSGGGKFPSQISRRKDQPGSLGIEEKISSPFKSRSAIAVALILSVPFGIIPQFLIFSGLALRKTRGDSCASPRIGYHPYLRSSSRERGSWRQAGVCPFRTGQTGTG